MILARVRASRWQAVAGIAVSSLLLAVYARGGPAFALGFVALVPWLWALDGARTWRGALLSGVGMAIGFVAGVLAWFGIAIGGYTGIGPVAGTFTVLALAPLLQPQFFAFALVRHAVGRRHGRLARALAGAAAWVACEWAWPKLLGDTLGHGLHPSTLLRQAADLGGGALLTLSLLLANEAVLAAIERRRAGVRAIARPLAAAVGIVAALAAYGGWRVSTLQAPREDAATLRIAMIQASITDYERLRREMGGAYPVVRKVLDTHYALSWSALRDHGADVLLWSETVYPTTFGHARSEDGALLDREIQGFVDAAGVPLVFGTYDLDERGEYNAAVFLEPGRGALGTYRKTHPFPLTEHVPRWLDTPAVRRLLPWMGTWQRGDGARVLPLRARDGREVQVVPLICLDDVRPGLAIDSARLGAQAIVGLSNDAWFSHSPRGARLHLQAAAFRSIETRLPQVRVTTNGLSAIVDDTGAVLATTGMDQQAVLTGYVSAVDPPPTLVVRWGDWVGRAAAAMLALFAAWAGLRRWRARVPKTRVDDAAMLPVLRAAVLPRGARITAGGSRVLAAAGLAWLSLDMALRTGWQVQSLAQLRVFGVFVVAPMLLAWAVRRAFAAQVRIEGAALVLDQRRRRIEIPLASIVSCATWRLPLPAPGLDLVLSPGEQWRDGIAIDRPSVLQRALAMPAKSRADQATRPGLLARMAEERSATWRRWLDASWLRFGLFPLLPALVAFRLHQVIAFGGPLGEWHTYGPAAWLAGLLIWWASWSLGLMLLAALLRIAVEAVCAVIAWLRPASTSVREGLEWVARIAFYIGVPAWLVLRLVSA